MDRIKSSLKIILDSIGVWIITPIIIVISAVLLLVFFPVWFPLRDRIAKWLE